MTPSDDSSSHAVPPTIIDEGGGLVIEMPPPLPPPMPGIPSSQRARKARGPRKQNAADGSSAPPPPFVGGPPGGAFDSGSPGPAADTRKLMADPEKAAKMLVGVVDGLLEMLARSRYAGICDEKGRPIVEAFAPTDDEKKELTDAVVLFMKASSMQMSPATNMLLCFGGMYGARALALEAVRSQVRKAQQGQG